MNIIRHKYRSAFVAYLYIMDQIKARKMVRVKTVHNLVFMFSIYVYIYIYIYIYIFPEYDCDF